jgi:methionine synthase II (cobalamin-independent)
MEILGTINKMALTESPFVKYLFAGVNNEGYWNSIYMSLLMYWQSKGLRNFLHVLVHIFVLTTTFIRSTSEQQQNTKIRIQLPTPTELILMSELLHTNSRSSYTQILRGWVKPSSKDTGVPLTLTVALSNLSWGMQWSKKNDFMDSICKKIAELFGRILF